MEIGGLRIISAWHSFAGPLHPVILHNEDGARKHFLRSLVATSGAPPDKSLRAVPGKSNSNEKKNEAVSIGSRVTLRADDANETLAG